MGIKALDHRHTGPHHDRQRVDINVAVQELKRGECVPAGIQGAFLAQVVVEQLRFLKQLPKQAPKIVVFYGRPIAEDEYWAVFVWPCWRPPSPMRLGVTISDVAKGTASFRLPNCAALTSLAGGGRLQR